MNDLSAREQKIRSILNGLNEPEYRFDQIKHAIYREKVTDYSNISSIPLGLRNALKERLGEVLAIKPLQVLNSNQAQKVLFETQDGAKFESVWMEHADEFHESVCISSQSGCALGCKFCYTGTMGLKKNLTSDEITDQVLYFRNSRNFVGNVSFMGMGEPFANSDEVFKAISVLTDKKAFGLGQRKINVSTVGIIPGIKRLTKEFPQVNLAFSLHTPFNDQRLELMPVTKTYPIDEVMMALDEHILKTKRKVFLAYILIKGINDSQKHANALVELIKSRGLTSYLYHVNLIKFHGGESTIKFKTPGEKTIKDFIAILTSEGIPNTLRQSFGLDIHAACGQLCVKP